MTFHKQTTVTSKGIKIKVDADIAHAVRKILRAGYRTDVSCQATGPETKKFRAYINPCCIAHSEFAHLPIASVDKMAEILGLKKGEYRGYNGVIWFNPNK